MYARSAGTVGGMISRGILHQLGGEHLLLVEPLASGVVELARPSAPRTAARESTRHACTQSSRCGSSASYGRPVISSTPLIRACTSLIRSAAACASAFDAERDRVGQDQRALQPLPRVPLVEARLPSAGDHQRVRGLHQHRAGAAEQDGDLPMDLPADAAPVRSSRDRRRCPSRHCIGSRRSTLDVLRTDACVVTRGRVRACLRPSVLPIPGVPGGCAPRLAPAPGSVSGGGGGRFLLKQRGGESDGDRRPLTGNAEDLERPATDLARARASSSCRSAPPARAAAVSNPTPLSRSSSSRNSSSPRTAIQKSVACACFSAFISPFASDVVDEERDRGRAWRRRARRGGNARRSPSRPRP